MTHEVMVKEAINSGIRAMCFMVVVKFGWFRQWKMRAKKQHDRAVECHSGDLEKQCAPLRR
jgi:hypothetical protein